MKNRRILIEIIAFFAVITIGLIACDNGNHPTYTLTFNGNGNSGGTSPVAMTENIGTSIIIPSKGDLVWGSADFTGWNTASNGSGDSYTEGSTYDKDISTTLYAQWTFPVSQSDFYGTWWWEGTELDMWEQIEITATTYHSIFNYVGTTNDYGIQTITAYIPIINDNPNTKSDYPYGYEIQYELQGVEWHQTLFMHIDRQSIISGGNTVFTEKQPD